jgi:hypothetical protein
VVVQTQMATTYTTPGHLIAHACAYHIIIMVLDIQSGYPSTLVNNITSELKGKGYLSPPETVKLSSCK